MNNIDASLVQLAAMQSLSNINEAINALATELAVIKDERDEYRRKWLEAMEGNTDDKALPTPDR